MENKKNKLNHAELESVSGGTYGQYDYVGSYTCPYCGKINTIGRYCYSGKTTWVCDNYGLCDNTFTIIF